MKQTAIFSYTGGYIQSNDFRQFFL
jgi:hypothetical protein